MKRLVYSPSVKVWVQTDTGVVDLSPYVVDCSVTRVINDVSSAEVEFRNPKVIKDGKPRFLFTENTVDGKILPVFHPMDPITIVMERIAGRPIQVFTGYCDSVPDVQLFPGTAKIKASCTLKRLLYTYWDPALPFVNDFMKAYGWNLNQATGQAGTADTDYQKLNKHNRLNDSGLGKLIYAVLNEIGGWDDKNIYIQPLPDNIENIVAKLFQEFKKDNDKANEEIVGFIRDIIGAGDFGSAAAGAGSAGNVGDPNSPLSGALGNEKERVKTIRRIANNRGIPPEFVLAVALVETDLQGENDGGTYDGWYQWASSQSYVGKPLLDMSKANDLGYSTDKFCQAAKFREKFKQYGYPTWARACQLNPSSINNAGTRGQYGAFNPNPDNNALYSDGRFPEFVTKAKQLLDKYK
jgi:hypothetical protein